MAGCGWSVPWLSRGSAMIFWSQNDEFYMSQQVNYSLISENYKRKKYEIVKRKNSFIEYFKHPSPPGKINAGKLKEEK